MSTLRNEPDFPPGHPARVDYDPNSAVAIEWRRKNVHPKGERDFPVDHPKASDTPGNDCKTEWLPGVDPSKPDHEPFTGRDPETAKRMRELDAQLSASAQETPVSEPREAPAPPKHSSAVLPTGQPGQ